MARKVTGGAVGEPSVGAIQVAPTAVVTAADNQNITLSPTGTGSVVITNNTILNAQSDLRFADADSSNYVAFRGASTISSNVTWTLPAADGSSNQAIVTNGTGTLSFETVRPTVSDETASATTHYVVINAATSGAMTSPKVSSTKLTYQPSTGNLSSTLFTGSASATATTLTTTNATFYPTFVSSNTTTTNQAHQVATAFNFNASTGTLTATIVTASSDERLKENVRPIKDALSTVLQLSGVLFNRIGQTDDEIGYIAQQVEKIIPQVIHTDADGMKSLAYGNLVALLGEAIREQQQQIEELKGRIA